jgi:hypothetical protein
MGRHLGEFKARGGSIGYIIVVFSDSIFFVRSSAWPAVTKILVRSSAAYSRVDAAGDAASRGIERMTTPTLYKAAEEKVDSLPSSITSEQFAASGAGGYRVPLDSIKRVDLGSETFLIKTDKWHKQWLGRSARFRLDTNPRAVEGVLSAALGGRLRSYL